MKPLFITAILLTGLLASCTLSGHYPDPKPLDRPQADYDISLSTVSRPHVGWNLFQARVNDSEESSVTDATVNFQFQMAHLSFIRPQISKGKMIQPGLYQAEAHLKMGGKWNVIVEIERPGFPKIRKEFVVSAEPL